MAALLGNGHENMKRTKGVTLVDGDLYYLNDKFNTLKCTGEAEKPSEIYQKTGLLEKFTWFNKNDREVVIKSHPEV